MPSSVLSGGRARLKRDLAAHVLLAHGEARLPVNGSSMLPSLWPGDVLEVRRRDVAEICPGDIVVFQRDTRLVVHRVVRRLRRDGATLLITRGDRRWRCDAAVSNRELLGRVEAVARGNRRFRPRLTVWSRAGSVLCRSGVAARVVGRIMRISVRARP